MMNKEKKTFCSFLTQELLENFFFLIDSGLEIEFSVVFLAHSFHRLIPMV